MHSTRNYLTPDRPRVVDLYCGAGGFSLGAHLAGFDTALALDIDKKLTSSVNLNFPKTKLSLADISKIGGAEILTEAGIKAGQVDGVIGGPPCQGFSFIGKRDCSDPRNALVWHFFRMSAKSSPGFS